MPLQVPYAMAPITRRVYTPSWADLVSHDVPFKDGLSGSLAFTIKAETPLLIGGQRRKAEDNQPGKVYPFQLMTRDGKPRYAIPPSTLQGMTRGILEVATFGRLGRFIDNKRFGVRDLIERAKPFYADRLNPVASTPGASPIVVKPAVKAGWLRVKGDLEDIDSCQFYFRACELARIEFSDLAGGINTWAVGGQASTRYGYVRPPNGLNQTYCTEDNASPYRHRGGSLEIHYRKAWPAGAAAPAGTGPATAKNGFLVFTGRLPDPRNPQANAAKPKHMEFFFFDAQPEIKLQKPDPYAGAARARRDFNARFTEFLQIHEPDDGRQKNPAWKFYRDNGYPLPMFGAATRQGFKAGGWMPIFYIEEPVNGKTEITSFGLAYMFKLAHSGTTHDLLRNSHPGHVSEGRVEGKQDGGKLEILDLPSCIFGVEAGEGLAGGHGVESMTKLGGGLKRRAWFEFAVSTNATTRDFEQPSVLSAPKPNYYPAYVRQQGADANSVLPQGATYASYTPLDDPAKHAGKPAENKRPELAGVKIWPATGKCLDSHGAGNAAMSSCLQAVDTGAEFKGRLHFHNLRPAELGALIWALSFGDLTGGKGYRHRLGMAKPYGLGEVTISLGQLEARRNDGKPAGQDLQADALKALETEMNGFCAENREPAEIFYWTKSAQVQALRLAAEPDGQRSLGYPTRAGDQGSYGQYVAAKRAGEFLPALGLSGNGRGEFRRVEPT